MATYECSNLKAMLCYQANPLQSVIKTVNIFLRLILLFFLLDHIQSRFEFASEYQKNQQM